MKKVLLFFVVIFSCVFLASCIDRSVPPLQNNTEWLSEDGKIHIYFKEGLDIAELIVDGEKITVPMRGYTEIFICPQEAFYDDTVTTDVGMFNYEMLSKDKNGKCNKMKMVFARGEHYEIGTEFILIRVAQNVKEENLPSVPQETTEQGGDKREEHRGRLA